MSTQKQEHVNMTIQHSSAITSIASFVHKSVHSAICSCIPQVYLLAAMRWLPEKQRGMQGVVETQRKGTSVSLTT